MRRFIKTITVKRHAQFTVISDSDKTGVPEFQVWRWDSDSDRPVFVAKEERRGAAIALAANLARQLEAKINGARANALLEDDEAAARAANQMTPASQEESAARRAKLGLSRAR